MDPNERARREFKAQQELRQMRQQFQTDLAAGRATVLDRFSAPVVPKALIVFHPPHDLIFEVADVKPVLDPRQPPGVVEMTLVCRVPLLFAVNTPIMSIIRVGTQQEPGHASLDEIKAQDAPVAPAPAPPEDSDHAEHAEIPDDDQSEPEPRA